MNLISESESPWIVLPFSGRWRIVAFVLACASAVGLLLLMTGRAETRQQREAALEWARLAPFPESAINLRSTTSGNMFTRSFRVVFSAPPAEIERWLRASPGTRGVVPDRPGPAKRRYQIEPGGGANFAEVTVDDATGEVVVDVSWG